jgi:hypothetical protein
MIDLELELAALEFQWREADDLAKAARAELVASTNDSAGVIAEKRKRVERLERVRESVMKKITALEARLDSASG